MNVTLYTRKGCHLCEAAESAIRRVVAGRADVTFDTVDIDADAELVQRYTVRVPVVAVDGVEIAEYEVDEAALRQALENPAARRGTTAEIVAPQVRQRRRPLRWFLLGIAAIVLLVGLTGAAVALITPDVFADACERPLLVRPDSCGSGAASQPESTIPR